MKVAHKLLFLIALSVSCASSTHAAEPTDQQTLALAREFKTIRAVDAVSLLQSHKGKPVAFFIYASWCPYCRGTMESIKLVMDEGGFNGIETVFVSLDTDFPKLSQYLLRNEYSTLFTPYVLKSTGVNTAPDTFRAAFGTGFTGGIPYFAVFNEQGNLASELFGFAKPDTLREQLQPFTKQ